MEKPTERTLGGEPGSGQDVAILLVPSGGSPGEKLAVIRMHSRVLSFHSKYFNTCWSERWNQAGSSSESVECILEVQTDVEYYVDCFTRMYSLAKTFENVQKGLELLKVASQIEYEELMERICFYLSSVGWSEEDRIQIREYAGSPGFSRVHLEGLVARLGMDESEENRQKQLRDLVQECTRIVIQQPSRQASELPPFLEGVICGPPSVISRMVVTVVIEEAKNLFDHLKNNKFQRLEQLRIENRMRVMCCILEALLKSQVAEDLEQLYDLVRDSTRAALKVACDHVQLPSFLDNIGCGPSSEYSQRIVAIVSQEAIHVFHTIANEGFTYRTVTTMNWILSSLLKEHVAEELVQAIVRFDAIPEGMCQLQTLPGVSEKMLLTFAELVILIFEDVVAGRLLLRPPERLALLSNWYAVLKKRLRVGSYEEVTKTLFLTLPLQQQTELLHSRKEGNFDYISTLPLDSLLQSHSSHTTTGIDSIVLSYH